MLDFHLNETHIELCSDNVLASVSIVFFVSYFVVRVTVRNLRNELARGSSKGVNTCCLLLFFSSFRFPQNSIV